MAASLIDTHAHLDSFVRRGEIDGVLGRARTAGVEAVIAIGTAPDDWDLYRDLASEKRRSVHYTVGLHPCSVGDDWRMQFALLEGYWHAAPAPVALGEVGLDRFHLPRNDPEGAERVFARQREAFAAGLELARRMSCPVVVHSRGAFSECVEMIDASGVDWSRVVFHCFSEAVTQMDELTRRGGRGSFTGIVTYKNADAVRAAVLAQGLGRLMVETDAPYLAPVPHRGEPNEPAYVRHTADACAALFGISAGELAERTTANARGFFGLPVA